ncbi:conserved hypothetical protein [Burkholderiales bacterium 8X]|nr:conserved hypothetical protein [Burkholderiales bacterium 8X]
MRSLADTLAPTATNMIRFDHTHVMATFHQYEIDTRPSVKKGLVDTACTALEIHAQLEEEIFYPAVRAVTENEALKKAVPEHNEMKRLISVLRGMEPEDPAYDETFMELMRDVLHHVADEETIVLPDAERMLADSLSDLGRRMMRRRMELTLPRTGEIVVDMARSVPASTWVLAMGAAAAGACLTGWLGNRRSYRLER